MAIMRLDKYIADSGRFSRKEAGSLIKSGRVSVNSKLATSAGVRIDTEKDEVLLDGEQFVYKKYIYIMMNKPAGVVSSTEDSNEETVIQLVDLRYKRAGVFPAGRLDKDAEGLIILTNDGNFAHRLTSPKHHVDKRYYVETEGVLTTEDCIAFEKGLILKDGYQCMPGRLELIGNGDDGKGVVTVHEGKYHQVKRMLASLGKPVKYLKRISIGGLVLDETLPAGGYREMADAEVEQIFGKVDV